MIKAASNAVGTPPYDPGMILLHWAAHLASSLTVIPDLAAGLFRPAIIPSRLPLVPRFHPEQGSGSRHRVSGVSAACRTVSAVCATVARRAHVSAAPVFTHSGYSA